MISTIVVPGTKFDMIHFKYSLGEEVGGKQYNSKVLDFMDDDTVKIATPFEHGLIVPLEIGEKFEFIFYTERGLYHCRGEIIDRYKEGRLSILVVRFLTDLEKFQRRQYFRLEYEMEILYRVITQEEAQEQWNTATIIDISGGGCRFYSQIEHEVKQSCVVLFRYTYKGKMINAQYNVTIVSSSPIEKRKGYFEYRVEFNDISVVERETLIKFIFEEERKIRRHERGLTR